jgi:hypothetical protein
MNTSECTSENLALASWAWLSPNHDSQETVRPLAKAKFDPWQPMRQWLEHVEVATPNLAHRLCKLIPAQCPFERDVKLFGRTLFHIPPMCKLNPLYEEVVGLRFRALCYLADKCGEDVTRYC